MAIAFHGHHLIIFHWTLLVFTIPFVIIRLYVQCLFRKRPWTEIFVVAAWIFFLSSSILLTIAHYQGWYNGDVVDLQSGAEVVMKLVFAESFTYNASMYACKMALLLFYAEITPQSYEKGWYFIWVSWILVAAGIIYDVLFGFLACRPLSEHWTYGSTCYRSSGVITAHVISWALYLLTDLLVYILPFIILCKLKCLTSQQKRGAYLMFAPSLIKVACTIVELIQSTMQAESVQGLAGWSEFASLAVWLTPVQQALAIILFCLPQVRRVFLGTSIEKMRPDLKHLSKEVDPEGMHIIPAGTAKETGIDRVSYDSDKSETYSLDDIKSKASMC